MIMIHQHFQNNLFHKMTFSPSIEMYTYRKNVSFLMSVIKVIVKL